MSRPVSALLFAGLFAAPCLAQSAPPDEAMAVLCGLLKPIILSHLPDPLYEKSKNWDHQAMVSHIQWRGLSPKIVKVPRNDGVWRKIRITSRNPAGAFDLKLTDIKADGEGRQTFSGQLSLMVGVEAEEQIWESGIRLYSGRVKGRLKLKLAMDCEATLRLEPGKSFLPDTVFRLRVVKADVSYDDLVVEHLAGIGGAGAKAMGEALHGALKQWRPSLERDLLAKANKAVVKAADTKEVRVSMSKLFEKNMK